MIKENQIKIERILQPYIQAVSKLSYGIESTKRMSEIMDALQNPQNRYKVIHVAGTSGKTSTAYYISSMIYQADQSTGLLISPHVYDIRERVQINNKFIDELEFLNCLEYFISVINKKGLTATYFEIMYAFGFWLMAEKKVTYAVVETGVGGLLDATNICSKHNKVCVITDIGLDHQKLLGRTLSEITAHKAGIIHKQNIVIVNKQKKVIMKVIENKSQDKNATLYINDFNDNEYKYIEKMPFFQRKNWALAYSAYQCIARRDRLVNLSQSQIAKTQKLVIPGRMEIKYLGSKTLVIDGAHNSQKISNLARSFKELFLDQKACIVISFKDSKDINLLADYLIKISDYVIVTSFNSDQYLRAKAVPQEELLSVFASRGIKTITSIKDHKLAVDMAFKSSSIVLVTGSFYLISQLRNEGLI